MPSTVVVGGFFGDEGKGKIISHLALKDNPSIVVRGGAGPNAGHTVQDGDRIYKIRMLPSGFLNKNTKVMIGPGVVVNPEILLKEIKDFEVSGRVFIDMNCGIIEETHVRQDSKGELKEKIGSTGSGTGPANRPGVGRLFPGQRRPAAPGHGQENQVGDGRSAPPFHRRGGRARRAGGQGGTDLRTDRQVRRLWL